MTSFIYKMVHRPSSKVYLFGLVNLVNLTRDTHVLVKLKDTYSPVRVIQGDYFMRLLDRKTVEHINDFYVFKDLVVDPEEIREFLKIRDREFVITDVELNGWRFINIDK